eukprot:614645-Pelagomonas_calceolata.AAC.1
MQQGHSSACCDCVAGMRAAGDQAAEEARPAASWQQRQLDCRPNHMAGGDCLQKGHGVPVNRVCKHERMRWL